MVMQTRNCFARIHECSCRAVARHLDFRRVPMQRICACGLKAKRTDHFSTTFLIAARLAMPDGPRTLVFSTLATTLSGMSSVPCLLPAIPSSYVCMVGWAGDCMLPGQEPTPTDASSQGVACSQYSAGAQGEEAGGRAHCIANSGTREGGGGNRGCG